MGGSGAASTPIASSTGGTSSSTAGIGGAGAETSSAGGATASTTGSTTGIGGAGGSGGAVIITGPAAAGAGAGALATTAPPNCSSKNSAVILSSELDGTFAAVMPKALA